MKNARINPDIFSPRQNASTLLLWLNENVRINPDIFSPRQNASTLLLWLNENVCIILYIFISSFLLPSCSRSEEERAQDVVVETLTAFYAGDVDAYMSHVDFGSEPAAGKDSVLRLVLNRYIEEVRRAGGLQSVEPLSAQLENDTTAVVSYALNYVGGARETCVVHLMKHDRDWKICVSN